jgi:UDP-N-acetylmuramyl pentapeptide phosphotransferase/UDP-N-acetylglucosamine-1-phosphate transferase
LSWEAIIFIRFMGPVLLSAALCGMMYLIRIEDAPDGGRKVQAAPVPNSGGVAILITLALSAWLAGEAGLLSKYWMRNGTQNVLAIALAAGAIGFVDDKWGMNAWLKLLLTGTLAITFAVLDPGLRLASLPLPLVMSGVALWLLITMNGVNFMDGSNGLAMGSSAIMLLGAAGVLWRVDPSPEWAGPAPDLAFLCVTAALAILGFLAWNLPGKLYAGDSGAFGIGAFFGGAGIIVGVVSTIWTAAILFLPFLVDVILTVFWRARNGRSIMTAHRDHAYQLFLRSGWKHIPVAVLWWVFSWACALVAMNVPDTLAIYAFFGLLIIGCALWFLQRLTLGRRLAAEGL